MRILWREPALLLALGTAFAIGCNQSNESQSKAPSTSAQAWRESGKADKTQTPAAPVEADKSAEYVLTVEGMT